MKGDVIAFDLEKRNDPQTGVEVVRLTDDVGDTDHPYFTSSQITAESRPICGWSFTNGLVDMPYRDRLRHALYFGRQEY